MAGNGKVLTAEREREVTAEQEHEVTAEQEHEAFLKRLREDQTMVDILIPMLPDNEDGTHVDQAEYVTHSELNGGEPYRVPCGMRVSVPRPYFEILKIKYPNL